MKKDYSKLSKIKEILDKYGMKLLISEKDGNILYKSIISQLPWDEISEEDGEKI
jgi:hypothetical protein